jgi:hypothetical protein
MCAAYQMSDKVQERSNSDFYSSSISAYTFDTIITRSATTLCTYLIGPLYIGNLYEYEIS